MKLTILVILAFLSLGVLSLTAPSKGFDFNFGGKSSLNTRFKETASRFHKSHHKKADEPEPTVEAKKEEEATDAKKEESTDASTEASTDASKTEGDSDVNKHDEKEQKSKIPLLPIVTDEFQKILDKVLRYATILANKGGDIAKKRTVSGKLPSFFPKKTQEQAEAYRKEREKLGTALKYLTEPWRHCVYPVSTVNMLSYCISTFSSLGQTRLTECKHSMCTNCCNHVILGLKYAVDQSSVGEAMGLQGTGGYRKIKAFITPADVFKCKETCQKEYPVESIVLLPPPPPDQELGKSEESAAKSCIDIRDNGIKAASGIYYVKAENKPATQVYCDMDTDGGGWTLMLAYKHDANAEVKIDSTQMPTDPLGGASHMDLQQLGYDDTDVTELRFFCTSKHNKNPGYMHFKTGNPKLIAIAMTGDQNGAKAESYFKESKDLGAPTDLNFITAIKEQLPYSTKTVGTDAKGGFWNMPFADDKGAWVIEGSKSNPEFACGDTLQEGDGNKYETLHQVWFRGQSPSKEFLEARSLNKKK